VFVPGANYASLLDQFDASAAGVRDVSLLQPTDASSQVLGDGSPGYQLDGSAGDGRGACEWCRGRIRPTARRDSRFCGRRCRQAAFRIRRRHQVEARAAEPMVMAYADPPYPGCAWMYRGHPDYAGEVDHRQLVASLEASYDGFALSTSARALATVLPLFRRPVRVCAWVKPIGAAGSTFGVHNAWEPLIVAPGRELRPGKRDWLAAQPARGGGSDLIGRKPEAFAVWLFELLGLVPGDTFHDLFPGTGIIGRAWAELSRP
jgi:hypothetical protein